MALFTVADHHIYSKYYGLPDFWKLDTYWHDFQSIYKESLVPLPVVANEATIAEISAMLVCPPGKCGDCCRYALTDLRKEDIERLTAFGLNKRQLLKFCGKVGEQFGLKRQANGSCQFLRDNSCTVYPARPTICRTFPIQSNVTARTLDGNKVEQIHIRVKCQPAVDVIRQVISKALSTNPDLVLLPDLTVIWRRNGN